MELRKGKVKRAMPKNTERETEVMPLVSPAIRTIAMPAFTNSAGDIFGGWLMSQMDLAAGSVAARCARGRCATIEVNRMVFKSPVKVGDEVTVFAKLLSIGTTSMKLKVSAWRRPRDGDRSTKVTEAIFTFVALDSEGSPRPVRSGEVVSDPKR